VITPHPEGAWQELIRKLQAYENVFSILLFCPGCSLEEQRKHRTELLAQCSDRDKKTVVQQVYTTSGDHPDISETMKVLLEKMEAFWKEQPLNPVRVSSRTDVKRKCASERASVVLLSSIRICRCFFTVVVLSVLNVYFILSNFFLQFNLYQDTFFGSLPGIGTAPPSPPAPDAALLNSPELRGSIPDCGSGMVPMVEKDTPLNLRLLIQAAAIIESGYLAYLILSTCCHGVILWSAHSHMKHQHFEAHRLKDSVRYSPYWFIEGIVRIPRTSLLRVLPLCNVGTIERYYRSDIYPFVANCLPYHRVREKDLLSAFLCFLIFVFAFFVSSVSVATKLIQMAYIYNDWEQIWTWDDRMHAFVRWCGFMNQLAGLTNPQPMIMRGILSMIFASSNGLYDAQALTRKDQFLQLVHYEVFARHPFWKAVVWLASFTELDLQKLVTDEVQRSKSGKFDYNKTAARVSHDATNASSQIRRRPASMCGEQNGGSVPRGPIELEEINKEVDRVAKTTRVRKETLLTEMNEALGTLEFPNEEERRKFRLGWLKDYERMPKGKSHAASMLLSNAE